MAEDHVNRQQFLVRDLGTNSVTFFPSSANIVRDVKDIVIKPGANEITILGLTPTADENSIKVDGKGSATITDMMVELVPNPDRYEDIYGSDDDDDSSDGESSSESESEDEEIKSLRAQEDKIIRQLKKVQERNNSATATLKILEGYGKTVEKNRPDNLAELLSSYQEQREKQFENFHASENENAELLKERLQAGKNLKRALDRHAKAKLKANKGERKTREAKLRAKEKIRQVKREEKATRLQFWPKKVFKITVSLDCISEFTPASSRRGSVTSLEKSSKSDNAESYNITLSLSYITNHASWAPRYDLSFSTPTGSGSIMYRAEFKNATSETWKDAKVTLSTSETTFQGLGDPIPQMRPWHIDLSKGAWGGPANGPLCSRHEYEFRQTHLASGGLQKEEPSRDSLFGLDNLDQEMRNVLAQQNVKRMHMARRHENIFANSNVNQSSLSQQKPIEFARKSMAAPAKPFASSANTSGGGVFGGSNSNSSNTFSRSRGGLFGSSNNNVGSSLFGSSRAAAPPPPGAASGFGASRDREESRALADEESPDLAVAYEIEPETETLMPEEPMLETLESSISESGLTVNYDIPGLRTLKPSFTHRRHRIATIQLKDVLLSHVLVPKLRMAAFLKAKVKNTSNYALLRGPVGVTLDGSFLGNTALPRASAGETISMSLGVDPGVVVTYTRTTMRKTQTGILNKESSSIYTRTCTITNTKSNRSIEGIVIDQVPISNEERLKVDVVQPRGLRKEKDIVKCGNGVTSTGKDDPKWGKATAVFKKGGELGFDFKIDGGKAVKFVIEYETRYPSTEEVVNA